MTMMDIRSAESLQAAGSRDALLAAQLLLKLVRARRFYLDELLEGDGPYWISVGLFMDQEIGLEAPLERVVEFADESIETSRYVLRQLIEHGFVEHYAGSNGCPAYRLTPAFHIRFASYLDHQAMLMRETGRQFDVSRPLRRDLLADAVEAPAPGQDRIGAQPHGLPAGE